MPFCDVSKLTVTLQSTLREIMHTINSGARQIALIVDADRHLLGTITDGDVRRAVLAGMPLDATATDLLAIKTMVEPLTAPVGSDPRLLLNLMRVHTVRHVPLVGAEGVVEDVVMIENLLPQEGIPLQAVIMAGGLGSRLRPLTNEVPKPMLPVGGRPLMQLTLERMRDAGIRSVSITTHYKPEKIIEYFGNGNNLGIELKYVNEKKPMGTAGSLGKVDVSDETMLVMNGDILTDIDFRAMLAFHVEHQASLTVAIRKYDIDVPYGVVETDGGVAVQKIVEKPVVSVYVNAGIYLLAPGVRKHLPTDGRHFDMTDLMTLLLHAGERIISFPLHEYWLDIGQPHDYVRAQEEAKKMRAHS